MEVDKNGYDGCDRNDTSKNNFTQSKRKIKKIKIRN